MCGIVGLISTLDRSSNELYSLIVPMRDALYHRGPDDASDWIDPIKNVAISHRRLAILDCSAAGKQPMVSLSGRYVIAFNGEIYNHQELRKNISHEKLINWQSNSDTESLLESIDHWGFQKTLDLLVGMFAIAVWDRISESLYLARDRFGEKPIYYTDLGQDFIFCSELKSLQKYPGFSNQINYPVIAQYLKCGYIMGGQSIWQGVLRLEPGSFIKVKRDEKKFRIEHIVYWDAISVATERSRVRFNGTDNEAIDELEFHLRNAVKRQMIGDVPIGALLSGGVDSTTVVAMMQEVSSTKVKTFCIGFDNHHYDESKYAKEVARFLGVDHTEYRASSTDAVDVINNITDYYDEPFADSSQIATVIVARLASKDVKVVLSGDGGDEIFGGYRRYFDVENHYRFLSLIPRQLLTLGGLGCDIAIKCGLDGKKVRKISGICSKGGLSNLYNYYLTKSQVPMSRIVESYDPYKIVAGKLPQSLRYSEVAMCADTVTYLPDDLLVKMDRASMASSLEVRAPFLDHTIFQFAWSLPFDMKTEVHRNKKILRNLLARRMPNKLFERPKMGFAIPLADWMRGGLRDQIDYYLSESVLQRVGFLKVKEISDLWSNHKYKSKDCSSTLWPVFILIKWMDKNRVI
jgi:asparagine synthase (glutamine-hydrolysing)